MFQWDDYRKVKFFGFYRVRPKRRKLQIKLSFQDSLFWGPYFAMAFNGRMAVIGFHTVPSMSKAMSDRCWERILKKLEDGKC